MRDEYPERSYRQFCCSVSGSGEVEVTEGSYWVASFSAGLSVSTTGEFLPSRLAGYHLMPTKDVFSL